jgi:hypothetical protein
MQATIYNTDMVPMSEEIEVDDDAEFDAVEKQATELAAKAAIRAEAKAGDGAIVASNPAAFDYSEFDEKDDHAIE